MLKRFMIFMTAVLIAVSISGCSREAEKDREGTRYTAQFLELFNTATQIVGYYEEKEDFADFSNLIYDSLKEYHQLYDIYHTYEGMNNLKTINDNAGIMPVKVDKKIIDLLLFSKEAYQLTNGKMNVALGSVLKIWHQYRTEGIDDPINAKLPPMELLEEKMNHTDIENLIINVEESTVFLADPEMSLDVGSIAKGYATEKVCQLAIEEGYESGLVSVGGNVRAIGYKDRVEEPWNVGIQDPKEADSYIRIVDLVNQSLVTSGVYQRYYTVDDKQYHHIIDSDTLMPSDYFTAVTILCEDSGMADVLSTALFNMSYEEGYEFIKNFKDTHALWILKSGEVKYSLDFETFIKK